MSTRCPVHWGEGHSDYCTILGACPREDRHQQSWAWPWQQWGWERVPVSKGLWEPSTLPTHQPRPGGRCSGEVFSPENWAPQQAECGEYKRGGFLGPKWG